MNDKVLYACIVFILVVSIFTINPAAGLGSPVDGSIIYVDVDAAGSNNGMSWVNAYTTLQPALEAAVAGSQVWVAEGNYLPSVEHCGLGERYKSFQLKNSVAAYGGFDPSVGDIGWDDRDWVKNPVILSGDIGTPLDNSDNSYHVFCHPEGLSLDSSAILDGFMVTAGNANGDWPENTGGGMFNASKSSPTLNNVNFSGNNASEGGGMYNYSSSPTMTNVTFEGNTSQFGGGMSSYQSYSKLTNVVFSANIAGSGGGMVNTASFPILTNVTFFNNSASGGYGGGMFNWVSSSPTLNDVMFFGNSAVDSGGGMYNCDASPVSLSNVTFMGNTAESGGGMFNDAESSSTLNNVTFTGNTATQGGGMANHTSSPALINVTFSNNSAEVIGGGMHNLDHSSPRLTNVTFSGNTAVNEGGGIYNALSSSPILANTILWGDTPGEIFNEDADSSKPVVTYSDIQGGYVGTGNMDADPELRPLDGYGGYVTTHGLRSSSPAIDAGNPDPATCPATDARGVSRPQDGDKDGTASCDMGAFEYLEVVTSITITSDAPDPSVIGQPFSVAFEVTSFYGSPTGIVKISDNTATAQCSTNLLYGSGSCNLVLNTPGTYTLVADYYGEDFYLPSGGEEEMHVVTWIRLYLPRITR